MRRLGWVPTCWKCKYGRRMRWGYLCTKLGIVTRNRRWCPHFQPIEIYEEDWRRWLEGGGA